MLSSKFCLIFKSNIFYRKPSGDCSCRVNIYDSLSHFVLEKKLIWEMSSFFISFWKENSIIYSQGESKFQDIPDWGNGSTYSSSSHFNCTIHCEKSFLKFSWISLVNDFIGDSIYPWIFTMGIQLTFEHTLQKRHVDIISMFNLDCAPDGSEINLKMWEFSDVLKSSLYYVFWRTQEKKSQNS